MLEQNEAEIPREHRETIETYPLPSPYVNSQNNVFFFMMPPLPLFEMTSFFS
jgi:hypothetical protein